MSARWVLTGGSVLAHASIVFALGEIRPPERAVATAVQIVETAPAEPPSPPVTEPEPPSPSVEPPRERTPAPPTRPKATPEQEAAPPRDPAPADLPDFGLELSGGGDGPGLAVAHQSRETNTPPRPAAAKTLAAATPAKRPPPDPCEEGPAKPKLIHLPQPAYTEVARAASVEGKVRVQMTVDESGRVVDAKALAGLGHGLDEAALQAARGATFEAAVRCGKPTRSTFTIAIRFSAS